MIPLVDPGFPVGGGVGGMPGGGTVLQCAKHVCAGASSNWICHWISSRHFQFCIEIHLLPTQPCLQPPFSVCFPSLFPLFSTCVWVSKLWVIIPFIVSILIPTIRSQSLTVKLNSLQSTSPSTVNI